MSARTAWRRQRSGYPEGSMDDLTSKARRLGMGFGDLLCAESEAERQRSATGSGKEPGQTPRAEKRGAGR